MTRTTTSNRPASNRPTHHLFVVDDQNGKAFWTRVGAVWPNRDGKGFAIDILPGLSISGRVVMREIAEEDQAQ